MSVPVSGTPFGPGPVGLKSCTLVSPLSLPVKRIALSDALRKAQSLGLDLVEIAPGANPPVCKIVDFGKFRYDISKQEKDKKPSGTRLKEIKFRVNIDDHDYLTKIRHGEDFLDRGNKVRVQLQFRGREMAHQELGYKLLNRVKEDTAPIAKIESEPRFEGRQMVMLLAPR